SEDIFSTFPPNLALRLKRPNLRYRFYRVVSPFSAHITIVTVEGLDKEGFCFSAGAACRETRLESWMKAVLEAVQGRYYVRYLKNEILQRGDRPNEFPSDFSDHAVYYSFHPEKLAHTVLNRAVPIKASR